MVNTMFSRSPMPMIHQARRTWRNRIDGNPFATDAVIASEIDQLTEAYLITGNTRLTSLLKVEIDRLETLV